MLCRAIMLVEATRRQPCLPQGGIPSHPTQWLLASGSCMQASTGRCRQRLRCAHALDADPAAMRAGQEAAQEEKQVFSVPADDSQPLCALSGAPTYVTHTPSV